MLELEKSFFTRSKTAPLPWNQITNAVRKGVETIEVKSYRITKATSVVDD